MIACKETTSKIIKLEMHQARRYEDNKHYIHDSMKKGVDEMHEKLTVVNL